MLTLKNGKTQKIQVKKQEQELPLPEPVPSPPVKQRADPLKEDLRASQPAEQVPAVREDEKTTGTENRATSIAPSTSSGRENDGAFPPGDGMKDTPPGNSDEPRGAGGAGYIKANFSYIRDMIIRRIIYPERAREMGWQGKVKVSFVIASDGFVKDIRILESSGIEILDRNAVETVRRASPFPRPPVAAQLIIPISYRLH